MSHLKSEQALRFSQQQQTHFKPVRLTVLINRRFPRSVCAHASSTFSTFIVYPYCTKLHPLFTTLQDIWFHLFEMQEVAIRRARTWTSVSHFTVTGTKAVWVAVLVLKKQQFALQKLRGWMEVWLDWSQECSGAETDWYWPARPCRSSQTWLADACKFTYPAGISVSKGCQVLAKMSSQKKCPKHLKLQTDT